MKEIWKSIKKFNNEYEISNFGRIRSKQKIIMRTNGFPYTRKEKVLKPAISSDGYMRGSVSLMNNLIPYKIHRLVAEEFVFKHSDNLEVNHIDGNKLNNHSDNLEWCTHAENCQHAVDNGLWEIRVGDKNGMAKLTKEQVLYARELKKTKGRFWGRNELAKEWGISAKHLQKVVNNPDTSWYNV